jgi:hypothetical protein
MKHNKRVEKLLKIADHESLIGENYQLQENDLGSVLVVSLGYDESVKICMVFDKNDELIVHRMYN